jgi:hypothetical protein
LKVGSNRSTCGGWGMFLSFLSSMRQRVIIFLATHQF